PLPPGPKWRLVRAKRKMLAGVCNGLAVATSVSVTWVRIAFVIAGFSGVGIVAYLVLALVLPAEDPATGRRLAPAPRETARWLRVALVAGPILGLTGLFGRTWRGPFLFGWFGGGGGFGLLLVAVGLFIIWLRRREDDERPVSTGTEAPAAEPVAAT